MQQIIFMLIFIISNHLGFMYKMTRKDFIFVIILSCTKISCWGTTLEPKVNICSDNEHTLKCSSNETIDIIVIHYGRFISGLIICNKSIDALCNGTVAVTPIVKDECQNKTSCTIKNDNMLQNSGNCYEQLEPHLEIVFYCNSNFVELETEVSDLPKNQDSFGYVYGIVAAVVLVSFLLGLAIYIRHRQLSSKPVVHGQYSKQTSNDVTSSGAVESGEEESHYDEISVENEQPPNTNNEYNHLSFSPGESVKNKNKQNVYDHSTTVVNYRGSTTYNITDTSAKAKKTGPQFKSQYASQIMPENDVLYVNDSGQAW